MSPRFALRRAVVVASASALLLGTALVSGSTVANASTKPKTGGILTFLEHAPRLDHLDPARIYTGRDLAFMNSFHTRTLVAYNPVPGAAGANLVPDLATNTGVPSNSAKTWKFTLRPGTKFEDGTPITDDYLDTCGDCNEDAFLFIEVDKTGLKYDLYLEKYVYEKSDNIIANSDLTSNILNLSGIKNVNVLKVILMYVLIHIDYRI